MPLRKAEYDAAISVVSVAFLDASLRNRPEAKRWLDEQVQQWLKDLGTWRKRSCSECGSQAAAYVGIVMPGKES